MAKEQISVQEPISYEIGLKLRDLEENQKLMRERILLIGNNIIESEEKLGKEITEIKKQMYNLQSDVKRIKDIISSLSEEIEKSARKEELAILSRQFKMFEPLNYVRMQDIDKIIEEKLNKHHSQVKEEKEINNKHEFWRGKT